MSNDHYLRPFGLGSMGMRIISIDYLTDLVLGRNALTGLDVSKVNHVQSISRRHVEILPKDGKLFITAKSQQDNLVFRNGVSIPKDVAVEIVCGDKISLVGPMQLFNYELVRGTMSPEMIESCYQASLAVDGTPAKRRRTDPSNRQQIVAIDHSQPSPTQLLPAVEVDAVSSSSSSSSNMEKCVSETAAKLEPHFECSICFGALASSHSISPCGHVFCYVCIANWAKKSKNCPICSADFKIEAALPISTMDGMIRELMKMNADPNVIFEWEDRVLQGLNKKKGIKHVPIKRVLIPIKPPPVAAPKAAIGGPTMTTRTSAAVASSGSAAQVKPAEAASVPIAGVMRFVDLTEDDAPRPVAPVDDGITRSAIVSYGKGLERFKCQCGGPIKPKHARVSVTETKGSKRIGDTMYHVWCVSSPSFRACNLVYGMIQGTEILRAEDTAQLKKNFNLIA